MADSKNIIQVMTDQIHDPCISNRKRNTVGRPVEYIKGINLDRKPSIRGIHFETFLGANLGHPLRPNTYPTVHFSVNRRSDELLRSA